MWAIALVACVVGIAITRAPDTREHELRLLAATGAIAVENERDSHAILSASGLVPGGTVRGRVTVWAADAALVLSQSSLVDVTGPGGGRLSERLRLRIEDVSDPATRRPIYAGGVGALPPTPLGAAPGGARRTYEFTVDFPDDGAVANAVMGSTTSIGFVWDVVAADGSFSSASSSRPEAGTAASCPVRPGAARARCRARLAYVTAKERCAKLAMRDRVPCRTAAVTTYRRALALIRCRKLSGRRAARCRARARRLPAPGILGVASGTKT